MRHAAGLILLALLWLTPALAAVSLEPGTGVFQAALGAGLEPSIRVYYVRPAAWTVKDRILIAMHGVNRNASDYRDHWVRMAEAHRLLVLAPEFPEKSFPGTSGYNLANMRDANGALNRREVWLFGAIDWIFKQVREAVQARRDTFVLYGHSAGAQFVHRFVLFHPSSHLELAISANAGWYTMPEETSRFPYGMKGGPLDAKELGAALGRPMIVLLGEADTDVHHPELRHDAETDRQGPHRLARGTRFFEAGRRMAGQLGVPFHWSLSTVPGVAHDDRRMSVAAAALLQDPP